MSEVDFEAEGLLGAPGELDDGARSARVRLLEDLLADGASVADLRVAVEQHRLVLLPMERALRADGDRRTPRQVAQASGLTLGQVDRLRETLGLPSLGPDEPALTALDAVALGQAATAVEAGVPFGDVLQINAVLAASMPGLAVTLRDIAATRLVTTDDERDTAVQLASAARDLLPLLMPVLEYALRSHLEQQVLADFVESGLGAEPAPEQSVGFADLVGFTRLTDGRQPAEAGDLSDRLLAVARQSLSGRARIVKTIGDAVMVTAPTPAELAVVMLDLVEGAVRSAELSGVRAGMAHGPVLTRAGDVFGRPVNLASRLTGRAPADALVCDQVSWELLRDDLALSLTSLEPVRLKGLEAEQTPYLVRRV